MTNLSDQAAFAEGIRTRWAKIDETLRSVIHGAIVTAVTAKLKESAWYSPFSDPPRVEVLGATEGEGGPRVHYIADQQTYCQAQSGSDWAEHDVFAGDVVLQGERVLPMRLELVYNRHVSEREWDDGFDPEPSFTRIREQELVRMETSAAHR